MAQPNVPSTFSTPSFGIELVFIGSGERPDDSESMAGEVRVFLVPPAIGMSTPAFAPRSSRRLLSTTRRSVRAARRCAVTATRCERLPGGYLSGAGPRRRHDEPGGHQGQLGRDRARGQCGARASAKRRPSPSRPPAAARACCGSLQCCAPDCTDDAADFESAVARRHPPAFEPALQDPGTGHRRKPAAHRVAQDHAAGCCATRRSTDQPEQPRRRSMQSD